MKKREKREKKREKKKSKKKKEKEKKKIMAAGPQPLYFQYILLSGKAFSTNRTVGKYGGAFFSYIPYSHLSSLFLYSKKIHHHSFMTADLLFGKIAHS